MNERTPEKVVSIENYFPADVLPTTRFISQLPGIDQEYGKFIGEGNVVWNGESTINGEPLTIRIAHSHQDTSFLLESNGRTELWEMEEHYCDEVLFRRKRAILPGTILNQRNRLTLNEHTPAVSLNFHGEREIDYLKSRICDACPLQNPQIKEKVGAYFSFKSPSDLPVRRVSEINVKKTRIEGFKDVQEAIDSIIALRDAIISAKPLLSDKSAPIPSSQSLISDRYFPQT